MVTKLVFNGRVSRLMCKPGLLETSKLEVFLSKLRLSVGCTGKIEFVVN